MDFGGRLKALRNEKGISRHELADSLNVTYSTIAKYETNVRFPKDEAMLKKISSYFSVSIDYLLGNSDIMDIATLYTLNTDLSSFISNEGSEIFSAISDKHIVCLKKMIKENIDPDMVIETIDYISKHYDVKKD